MTEPLQRHRLSSWRAAIATLVISGGLTACLSDVPMNECAQTGGCSAGGGTSASSASSSGGRAGNDAGAAEKDATAGDDDGGNIPHGGAAGESGGAADGGNMVNGGAGGREEPPAPLAPVVVVGADPELCAGQSYTIPLSVVGGTAPFTWSLDTSTATVVAGVDNNAQLTGIAPSTMSQVTLTVGDTNGQTSQPVVVALNVAPTGVGRCPTIETTELPAPCLGYAYNSNFISATGGTGTLTVTLLEHPAGLTFDADRQLVTGVAVESGPLTLQVTDTLQKTSQRTFLLQPRDKCWLAYMSTDIGVSKLHLFDPVLRTRAPAIEASPNNIGVTDFDFSPDGKFVVYRRAQQDLVLAAAPTWAEKILTFGDAVLEYSWSRNGSTLAVAYKISANTMLGGLNVANAKAEASPSTISGLQMLTPVAMIDPDSSALNSPLLWIQNDTYIAFHADAEPGFGLITDNPYFSYLTSTGFSKVAVWDNSEVSRAVQLRPAHNGIFAADPGNGGQPQLNFFGTGTAPDWDAYLRGPVTRAVPDPGGNYVAAPIMEKLQVYLTAESAGGTADQPANAGTSDDACVSILSWDESRERIACDAPSSATPGYGEMRIFDLTGLNAQTPIPSVPVKALSGYRQADATGHQRSVSAKGDWFAVATDQILYITDLRQAPTIQQTVQVNPSSLSGPDQLEFSPDETMLLWQQGSRMAVISLQTNGGWFWVENVSGPQSPPPACQEQFNLGPNIWCGNRQHDGGLSWAPNSIGFGGATPRSRFAAALTISHALSVYDFANFSQGGEADFAACEANCADEFKFQPDADSTSP